MGLGLGLGLGKRGRVTEAVREKETVIDKSWMQDTGEPSQRLTLTLAEATGAIPIAELECSYLEVYPFI